MKFDESDNPMQVSNEELLRFLDAGIRISGADDSRNGLPGCSAFETRSLNCPPAESYLQLAMDAVRGDEAEALLTHASVCPECATALTGCLSVLEGNPSKEEIAAIQELASARIDWQRQIAREMAATPARKSPRFSFRSISGFVGDVLNGFGNPGLGGAGFLRWLPGAAIALVLVLTAGLWFWHRSSTSPEHQLALAYQESRTMELRIPDANYAELTSGTHTRGAMNDREPAPLLDARARLARALEQSPQDSHWLQLQARADLLEERFDSAIDVLDRLRAQGPATPELLADLAAAYYQRGLTSGSEADRSTALDYLRQADQLAPTDPVILFNEAVVMEDRGQMINAVEVWNRYITLERDAKWKAEGQRKLTELEQSLTRLKSHASRMRQMLSSPQSMDALSKDQPTLAALDEELSSYELDSLLLKAFPAANDKPRQGTSSDAGRARASPCAAECLSARHLLEATGHSLELQHHDPWLSDLLTPLTSNTFDTNPSASGAAFSSGMRLLAQATAENIHETPVKATQDATKARNFFEQAAKNDARLRLAAHVAERRATVEAMFGLQRQTRFAACREAASLLRRSPENAADQDRYPWMTAQAMITEEVCDQTPETRSAGRALGRTARQITGSEHYRLLGARANMMLAGENWDSGDDETAERLTLPTLRDLYAGDSPPYRIFNTVGALAFAELRSPRPHTSELYWREMLGWAELDGSLVQLARVRAMLAPAEIRNGELQDAAEQMRLAEEEVTAEKRKTGETVNFSESLEGVASAMLETGDLSEAAGYLDRAAENLKNSSDPLLERQYAMTRGQLELSLGHANQSAELLEQAIRLSEGSQLRKADQATSAEFAQKDHDAYAELVAAWLAEGRSPESVLALWERFRLRSRGLPIAQCEGGALDCETTRLRAEEHNLGEDVLLGQVVLLDRMLVYRVDRNGVTWTQISLRRQSLLDAAQALEQAVSSPNTSPETAAGLGAKLSAELLPKLPSLLEPQGSVLLEADPLLENLAWPVLPTPRGPLGLAYPVAELQSILAPSRVDQGKEHGQPALAAETRALVVGASVVTEGEPPLPEAMTEAEDVGRMLHARALLTGDQATAPRVAQALGSATIFHFAGHAVQTVNGTELLLAPSSHADRTPWVDGNFLRLHPPRVCRLAVLSACATGARAAAWNHPLQDMVQTLGALGVPEVVATRWQIDSSAAVPFMDTFYNNLRQGKSVPLALMSARRLQSGESTFKNPYYWGAYYVAGRETRNPSGELHAQFKETRQGQKE